MEPEEVYGLCEMDRRAKMADLVRLEEYQALGPIDRLRELAEADKAGRWYMKALIGSSDKAGIAIREGDILRQGKRRFVVCYTPDIACFVARPEDGGTSYPCLNVGTTKSLEVVGSVYDHEEVKLERRCDVCKHYSALAEPREKSDGATIYGYCFQSGDKNHSPYMGKGYPVFIDGAVCKAFVRKRRRCPMPQSEVTKLDH